MAMITGRVQYIEDTKPKTIKIGSSPKLIKYGNHYIDENGKVYEKIDLLKEALKRIRMKKK